MQVSRKSSPGRALVMGVGFVEHRIDLCSVSTRAKYARSPVFRFDEIAESPRATG
jgi:hypothetical protein